ncbi:hypothetical protein LJC23_01975 [Desulfovibrio sp. OttesenSCG-928-I05]|nr:hypothetical protein [Desulfovibrio sp. OttesenSCG-928-I05]
MIVIDGRQSTMDLGNFANLEEVLVKVMEDEIEPGHIVTDVIVNDEAFSEIYPHQAEDIERDELRSVEVRSVSMEEMAGDIVEEMVKVIGIMQNGSKNVAGMFRQGDTSEALEVLQDLLDVARRFLGTIGMLSERFQDGDTALVRHGEELSDLVEEMVDVMDNQDWLLLADLLEYELIPSLETWHTVLADLRTGVIREKE